MREERKVKQIMEMRVKRRIKIERPRIKMGRNNRKKRSTDRETMMECVEIRKKKYEFDGWRRTRSL